MANSLLDFVMSLVRDPAAAARYAEDPAQAIADAHLVGVSAGDVDNLIPVVSESVSMALPGAGSADNVWASGAATAAFDAFDDLVPATGIDDVHIPVIDDGGPVVHTADVSADAGIPDVAVFDDPGLHVDAPLADDVPVADDWGPVPADVDALDTDDAGFDFFD